MLRMFTRKLNQLGRGDIVLSPGTWWAIWSLAFSTVWLLPAVSQLWPSFDMELASAACCITLLVVLTLIHRGGWRLPLSAIFVAGLSLVPILQYAAGTIYFFGDAWMSFLYLMGFSLAILLGERANTYRQWADALFFAFGLAAVLSVAIALKQWLGVEGLPVWTREIPPGDRPFANIGQPNNLATLICWGLVALWRAYLAKRLSGAVTILTALYLMFGLALTQSRTGWLMALSLSTASVFFRDTLQTRRYWIWVAILLTVFIFDIAAIEVLGQLVQADSINSLNERFTHGYRADHWRTMLAAIQQRPWLGWGWGQVSVAQQHIAPSMPPVPELIGYSHNLLLDIFVWNGIPLAAGIILVLTNWIVKTGRSLRATNDTCLYLAVGVLLIHSLIEYPYAYAYFLLPAGLMIGALGNNSVSNKRSTLPRSLVMTISILGLIAVILTIAEYFQARNSFTALRFEMARIGSSRNSEPPHLILLTQLSALATTDRMEIHKFATEAELKLSRMTSERFPAERTLMQYAALAAGRGEVGSARLSLIRLCKLYEQDRCVVAESVWNAWGVDRYPWVKLVPFPVPRNEVPSKNF